MNNTVGRRIILDLILLLSIMEGWWLVAFLIAIVIAMLYRYPFEIIVAGVIYDSLFGLLPGAGITGYAGTIAMICVFLVVRGMHRWVRR